MTTRPRLAAAAMLVLALGASSAAEAQPSPAERADKLNEEGKELFRNNDLNGAANKFRQAIVLSPEGRFYYNLCYIYEKQGKLREALTACEAVKPNGAVDRVIKKTDTLIGMIRPRLPKEPANKPAPDPVDPDSNADPNADPDVTADPNADPDADPNTDPSFVADPNQGGTAPPDGSPPQGPPEAGIVQAPPPPPETYRWSIGAGLGAVSSAVGAQDAYGSSGGQFRLHADFLLFKDRMMGISPYLHVTDIASGDGFVNQNLNIVDIGGAVYKHIPYRGFEITPVGGAHLAIMQPESFAERVSMVTVGLRGEVAFSWAFGTKLQHVVSVTPGLNLYFPASGGKDDIDPSDYGLDVAGSTVTIAIGYTHRFTTPFGQVPLITLE